MQITLLKSLDRYFGCLLTACMPRPVTADENREPPGSILLIRPGGIGDAVHLAPTIRVLKQNFSDLAIDILAEDRNAGVFELCPAVRETYRYNRPGDLLTVLRNRYDAVIDTEQWHRLSAVVARLVRSPVKVGYATNERARMFTHALSYSHEEYEANSFLQLLGPLGMPEADLPKDAWLVLTDEAVQSVATLTNELDGERSVVLFPGASITERRWGVTKFRAVAEWCLGHGLQVVVVGGAVDMADAQEIASGHAVLDLAGRTSLTETAAVLERAAVVVSGDSGVLHIAVGLDRPTVSLFGSGIAAKWAPRGDRHVVLNRNLSCSPCTRFGYTPPCPYHVRCLEEIRVDDVTTAIASLLRTP